VRDGHQATRLCRATTSLLLAGLLAPRATAAEDTDPIPALEASIAAAEASLQKGDREAAAAGYREALFLGRLLLARLDRLERRPDSARRQLDAAAAEASSDPQAAFALASENLWLGRPDTADSLFARVLESHPGAETYVLIGRAYRDGREYGRARAALEAALRLDPAARRAHYYLGMSVLAEGKSLDAVAAAEREFRQELKLVPGDPLTSDQLGLLLLDSARPEEARPFLEATVRAEPRSLGLSHLGRCQLALDQPADAAVSLRRALQLAPEQGVSDRDLGNMHFQLGQALRRLGRDAEARGHLAEARRLASEPLDQPEAPAAGPPEVQGGDSPPRRSELRLRASAAAARACFNLGVLEAQSRQPAVERYTRAAARFEQAAELDPGFPQLQASLGIAYFNARQFEKATGPLTRALAASPGDLGLQRMLATAWLDIGHYDEAARLLKDDPGIATRPEVAFAYGVALLRLGYAAAAVEPLQTAARLAPGDAEAARELGEARRLAAGR